MEKLSTKKKSAIVRQYLSGLSYDEIAAKSSVSKGTVANVVADLKAGRFPEAADTAEHIDLLRALSLELKRSNMTPGQCATGLTVLSRITECGLDPADIERWPLILKSAGSEDKAREFVETIYAIQEVQMRTGVSLEDLDDKVHELEGRAAELEPMLRQHENYRKQLVELTGKRDNLVNEVAALEQKYNLLNPRVKDLEKREQDLLRRTKGMDTKAEAAEAVLATLSKEKQRLLEIGLSPEALAEFSQRAQSIAQHRHITPVELRERLLQELENLGQTIGLETLIQSRQAELEERERAIAVAEKESQSLKTVIGSFKQEKASLEASLKETREKVGTEMVKITTSARDMVNTLAEELRRGHDEALAEVRRLMDEAVKVGKEIGRYQEMLQANQWLSELLALVRGEEGIEGKRVRAIALSVLRGTTAWLKHHYANKLAVSTLSFTLENLIREVEQWKV
jgi:DNA repair exonuclease SbcCD ATPase subunit